MFIKVLHKYAARQHDSANTGEANTIHAGDNR